MNLRRSKRISEKARGLTSMESGNLVVDDPPQNEDIMDSRKCVTVFESVREQLDCPVCFKIMLPPIYQCSNGHPLCHDCKPKVHNQCPTCRHELGNTRCLTLEKAAASLEVQCKYENFGCMGTYTYDSMLNHEFNCVYKPYHCPANRSECEVISGIPYLLAHLKDDHKVRVINGRNFLVPYLLKDSNSRWPLVVLSCLGRHFCLHVDVVQLGKFRFIISFLQLMGDENEAKNYGYSMTVSVGRQGRKTLGASWQWTMRSMRDNHLKIRDSLEGVIIRSDLVFSMGVERRFYLCGNIWKKK